MANEIVKGNGNTIDPEEKRVIDACLSRFVATNTMATLKELRLKDNDIKGADIDKRITTRSANALYLLNDFTLVDMKFQTNNKHEMLSFRTFFNAFIERKSNSIKEQSDKDYMLVFDFICANDEEGIAYRTTLFDPIMCFMEQVNDDFVLHFLFQTDKMDFFVEGYDPNEVKAELEYYQAQIEEEGVKKTSASSELDDSDEEEDPYYTDNM